MRNERVFFVARWSHVLRDWIFACNSLLISFPTVSFKSASVLIEWANFASAATVAGASNFTNTINFNIHFNMTVAETDVAGFKWVYSVWHFDEVAGISDVIPGGAVIRNTTANKVRIDAGWAIHGGNKSITGSANASVLIAISRKSNISQSLFIGVARSEPVAIFWPS